MGTFRNQEIIEIKNLHSSSTRLRSKTNLNIAFNIPDNGEMDGCNYVSVTLPYYWGIPSSFAD